MSATTGYVPGSSRALVLGPVVALLGEHDDSPTVTALWEAVAEGAPLTALLSVVMRDGLEHLPAFALASVSDGQVHAFVHGDVEVSVETTDGEVRTQDGRRISTWSEVVVDDAARITLREAGADPAGPALPLIGGVVLAAAVTVDVPGPRDLLDTAGAADEVEEPTAVVGSAVSAPAPSPAGPPPGVPDPPVLPETPAAVLGVADEAGPGDEDDLDELDIDTGLDGLDGADGRTVLSSELVEIRRRLPHWPDDEVPGPFPLPGTSADPDRRVARLVLSSGVVVALDRRVLLGRSPMVSRAADTGEVPRLVTVESPHRDISRTHAEVRMTEDGVEVTDLHSTNGVYLETEGRGVERLAPGEPTVVAPEAVVDIGDGVSFVVELD